MIAYLALKSAGIGIGTFVGVGIGLFVAGRRGSQQTLLGDSVLLTALAAGLGAWCLAMLVNSFIGVS